MYVGNGAEETPLFLGCIPLYTAIYPSIDVADTD
jgi:hypothetical protein